MISSRILALLNQVAILFPVFLVIFTFKGFIQALTAKLMGDRTAEQDGFLTINPLAHLDMLGLMIVLFGYLIIGVVFSDPLPRNIFFIILVTFGARMIIPVPVDDRNFKNFKRGGIITSLSGSFGNFILAIAAVLLLKCLFFFSMPNYILISLMGILTTTLDIAILFGILNLIPLPPFDGGRLLKYVVPQSQQHIVTWLEEYSLFIFLIIFFAPGISDGFFAILSAASITLKKLLLGFLL